MQSTKSPPNSLLVTIHVTLLPGYRVVGNRIEIDLDQAKRIVTLFRDYVRNR